MITTALNGFAAYLIKKGLLEEKVIENLSEQARQKQQSLILHIAKNHRLNHRVLANAVVDFFNLTFIDLTNYNVQNFPQSIIDDKIIRQHNILPIEKNDTLIHLAIVDPSCLSIIDEIKFRTGLNAKVSIADYSSMQEKIETYLNLSHYHFAQDDNNDFQIINYVQQILIDAVQQGASDIHFEIYEKLFRIRMRIDGFLYDRIKPPIATSQRIISRIKVLANLDIAEKRLPQDGRFTFKNDNLSRECRVSTCPTLFGEKVVIRILENDKVALNVDELGFEDLQKQWFLQAIQQPQGLILVTGPTGSGKSVTLYTALNILNTEEKNISTVEDPVEIQLSGINQVHTHPKIGLTFAHVLRTFLRQDPDVIMVGEIRDLETADIAIKAAHTGHLVLSTLHTNNAAESLTRLQNMGIANYNIATAVNLIIAQRLVRKLCPHCKIPKTYPHNTLEDIGFKEEIHKLNLFSAGNCDNCMQGYKGRLAIFEFLPITEKISAMILNHSTSSDIIRQAKTSGMITLKQSALQKIKQGLTSIEEVNFVLGH